MLACTHQRCGALIILEIDLRPLCQECLHHVHPAMAHSEHQSRLTGLGSRRQESNTGRNRVKELGVRMKKNWCLPNQKRKEVFVLQPGTSLVEILQVEQW